MKIYPTILILLSFLFPSLLQAEEHYLFSSINSSNGLSGNRVHCITQLQDGRIVIMTDGLVNLYDGTSFHYLHIDDKNVYPLKDYHGYYHPYVENGKYLWLKDYQRLLLFDLDKECFVPNLEYFLKQEGITTPISNFFVDSKNRYWFLTHKNQLIYKAPDLNNTKIFISDLTSLSGKTDKLLELTTYEDQVFLSFQSGQTICLNLNTKEEIFRYNPLSKQGRKNLRQVIFTIQHRQYLYQIHNGSEGILLRYNIEKKSWETLLQQNYWLNTLSIDLNGDIWLSCEKGIWHIDKTLHKKEFISQIHLVNGQTIETAVNTLFCDNQGGVWLGTSNRGLFYYHPNRFKFKNIGKSSFGIDGKKEFRVNCFIEKDSNILVGTPIGLFQYSPKNSLITRYKNIPQKIQCFSMLKDQKSQIWICAAEQGLYCIDDKKIKNYTFSPHSVFYMYENPDGSFFLCLGHGFGLFSPETGIYKPIKGTEHLNVIYQIAEFDNNSLIGLSDAGIFIFDRTKKYCSLTQTFNKHRPPIFQQNNFRYDCLYTDSRGLTWIGTRDGLSVWNPQKKKLQMFHTENGLVNNRIQAIQEDLNRNIWVSTSGGISRIDIKKENDSYRYLFSNYNQYDGIIDNEFFERAAYCTPSGLLLWGGIDGFNEITPQKIQNTSSLLPKPLFTKLFISGTEIRQNEKYDGKVLLKKSITTTTELELAHNQNSFSLQFTALNYMNPTQTFYRFKLENMDNSWREIAGENGIGKANYTNLAPGNYIFKVYAANNKDWGKHYAELKIKITPPFYKTTLAYITYVIGILAFFYLSTSYYLKKKKRKLERQQIENLDKMKYRFYTNMSHELRTPLTLILTPLEILIKKTAEISIRQQLVGIYRNAKELLTIVNQLLDFQKLETTGETLRLSYCNINELFDSICLPFKSLAQNKAISFEWKQNTANLFLYVDKDKLHKIINNLLSNAYKFTSKGGYINVSLNKCYMPDNTTEAFSIRVTDTGYGIPSKDIPLIFSRFYQSNNSKEVNTGSGIGLHLSQEYAKLHNGIILAESKPNKGSTFTVYIPTNLQPEISETKTHLVDKKHTLLIVEDNIEFRDFLCSQLTNQYSILNASNGQEGLEKAITGQPNIIISDVMMPEMNGFELCNKLKQNIQTSHIPIILLTALSSDDDQLKGYGAGADAYISKPFNMEILQLRIQSLIDQQVKYKELFKKAIIIHPESVTTSNIDEKLIRDALRCVEKNLNNPLYSVDQFGKDMNMDRTGLYRKLMAIVGQSPVAFIRTVRLKRAAQLLKQGYTVSEVADMIGFGTTSYFSKCFQEEFGIKPSQYAKQEKSN